jgi:hypothetical protein
MHELRTEIEIDGTPAEVWEILADLPAYGGWNPFMTRIAGDLRPGERLDVRLEPVGERGITLHPTVLVAEPGRELRWIGRLGVRGVFDGEHVLEIQEVRPGRVRFVQHERFTGVLTPLLWRKLQRGTAGGFVAMNEALARRVAERRRQLAS